MARLEANRPNFTLRPGAAREGRALLQGLAYCRRRGLRMHVRHQQHDADYCGGRDHRRFDAPICCYESACQDAILVKDGVLVVVNAGAVTLSLMRERLLADGGAYAGEGGGRSYSASSRV